jgi:hypothetical protein
MAQEGARLDGKEGGLSGKTILHHHRLLSKIFNTAVLWELIATSPMKMVTPPKAIRKVAAFYDDKEVLELVKQCQQAKLSKPVKVSNSPSCYDEIYFFGGLDCEEQTC